MPWTAFYVCHFVSLLFAVFLQHWLDKVTISTSKLATWQFLPGKFFPGKFFLAVLTKDLGQPDCWGFLSVIVGSLPYKNFIYSVQVLLSELLSSHNGFFKLALLCLLCLTCTSLLSHQFAALFILSSLSSPGWKNKPISMSWSNSVQISDYWWDDRVFNMLLINLLYIYIYI